MIEISRKQVAVRSHIFRNLHRHSGVIPRTDL